MAKTAIVTLRVTLDDLSEHGRELIANEMGAPLAELPTLVDATAPDVGRMVAAMPPSARKAPQRPLGNV